VLYDILLCWQHLAEAKVKATAVFGVSGGGIIDDD
jgi:hypothetical protein